MSKSASNVKTLREVNKARWLTVTAIFMALNIIMSMSFLAIPLPTGHHLYLCDTVINTAALLLDPVAAFIVGGVGSFLGDMMFYPQAMFVSLVAHGLQAVAVSLIAHTGNNSTKQTRFLRSLVATLVGAVIMVVGYTLGKTFVYSTFEAAMLKLPFEILQGLLGVFGSLLLCYKAGLAKIFKAMELE